MVIAVLWITELLDYRDKNHETYAEYVKVAA